MFIFLFFEGFSPLRIQDFSQTFCLINLFFKKAFDFSRVCDDGLVFSIDQVKCVSSDLEDCEVRFHYLLHIFINFQSILCLNNTIVSETIALNTKIPIIL